MKLRLYSDLHNEFDLFQIPTLTGERDTVLLLAGDVGVARKHSTYKDFLLDAADRFKAVIYVPGNHEYYGGTWPKAWDDMKAMVEGPDNLHMLNLESVRVDDVMFIGATLWTDFREANPVLMLEASHYMNDYRSIGKMERGETEYKGKLKPVDTLSAHYQARSYIYAQLAKVNDLNDNPENATAGSKRVKSVVVTHHGPSFQSTAEEFLDDTLNCAYMTDLEDEILEYKPDLWVHGHVHNSFDYHVGGTRVVTNPRGYAMTLAGGENKNFKEDGIIYEDF